MFAKLLAMFTKRTPAQRYMAQARQMVAVARANLSAGYPLAAKAAMQSAMSYRAAAHANRFYSNKGL